MEVIKSANDKRDYRVITLDNGLRALLVSNPPTEDDVTSQEMESESEEESDEAMSDGEDEDGNEDEDKDEDKKKSTERQSAAALCIGVGSFSDPDDIPGFAHFLEHMVFMGSEKFPKENELDDYLGKHGGYSNAWTDCEKTLFYFEIQKKNFYKALDMFAHFFISPLLLQDCVDREVEAVDSEFQMSVPHDGDRINQLTASMTKKGHPLGKFMCGNLKTLKTLPEERGANIYDHLRKFYEDMYSANYMTLAIESKECLDDIERYVREIFSKVPNNQRPQPTFEHMMDPYKTEAFTKFYKVSSVENTHNLNIMWALPPLQQHYRVKPLEYISTLITHEGKGSILSYLKNRTLALSLSGGNSSTGTESNSTCSTFDVSITLTDKGLNHVEEILTLMFQYILLMQKVGPQKHIFDEMKTIEENKFRWMEAGDPIYYVEQLSENMQMFPVEHYLTGRDLLYDYDEKLIRDCTNMLTPESASIILRSKSFDSQGILDKEEKWYGTKYCFEDVDPNWLEAWKKVQLNPELHIPEPNQFISTNFDLLDYEAPEHPELLLEEDGCKFWFKKDNKFKVPKGCVYIDLKSSVVYENIENILCRDLFLNLLRQNLTEIVYPAMLANYEYSLDRSSTGMIIMLNGFNHKLPLFLKTILEYIENFTFTQELFEAVKVQLKKSYYNDMIRPSDLARILDTTILEPHYYPLPDRHEHVLNITGAMLETFVKQFRHSLFIECITYGNFMKKEVMDMAGIIKSKLRLSVPSENMKPKKFCRQIPEKQTYCRVNGMNKEDNNSCVVNYYQSQPGSLYHSVLNELLVTRMKEPCFDILRTKHQLGYSVGARLRINNGILGLQVKVESQATKFSLTAIEDHITKFLQDFEQTLLDMTKEDFTSLVKSLITTKQLAYVSSEDEMYNLWTEIRTGNYVFDRRQKEIAVLEKLTHKELVDWYQQYINSKQRKISIQVEGRSEKEGTKPGVDSKDEDNVVITPNMHLVFKGQGEPDRSFISNIDEFKNGLVKLPYAFINC